MSLRTRARLVVVTLVAVVLALAAPASVQAGGGSPGHGHGHGHGHDRVTVMTQNLYLGSSLTPALTATTPEAFVAAVAQIYGTAVFTTSRGGPRRSPTRSRPRSRT